MDKDKWGETENKQTKKQTECYSSYFKYLSGG